MTVRVCFIKPGNGVATGANWCFCWQPSWRDGECCGACAPLCSEGGREQRDVLARQSEESWCHDWFINKGLLFPKPRSPSVFPSCDTVWKTRLDLVGWVICVVTGVVCPQFLSASPDEASQTHQQATRSEVCQWPSAGWSQHGLSDRLGFCPRITGEAQQLPEFGPITRHWGDPFWLLQWITRELLGRITGQLWPWILVLLTGSLSCPACHVVPMCN